MQPETTPTSRHSHAESVRLENRVKLEDEHVSKLYHEHMTASKALVAVGGDADAARIEEDRRTVLADGSSRAVSASRSALRRPNGRSSIATAIAAR